MREERNVTLILKCIVKGYHVCDFSVEDDKVFVARRKRGESGNGFKGVTQRGQLDYLQAELVAPLWPF